MSNMARSDEIDDLVSTVRDFVSHKEQQMLKAADRLVLLPDQRVSAEVAAMEAAEDALAHYMSDTGPDASNVLMLDTEKPANRAGLEATIAELEAAVTARSEDWEPDEGEEFAQAAWAVSAFEAPDAPIVEEETAGLEAEPDLEEYTTAQAEDGDDAREGLDAADTADVVPGLDQEALRALVVAAVHDELGGELGERITQNVRKLVRREINRVLASQEMDQE